MSQWGASETEQSYPCTCCRDGHETLVLPSLTELEIDFPESDAQFHLFDHFAQIPSIRHLIFTEIKSKRYDFQAGLAVMKEILSRASFKLERLTLHTDTDTVMGDVLNNLLCAMDLSAIHKIEIVGSGPAYATKKRVKGGVLSIPALKEMELQDLPNHETALLLSRLDTPSLTKLRYSLSRLHESGEAISEEDDIFKDSASALASLEELSLMLEAGTSSPLAIPFFSYAAHNIQVLQYSVDNRIMSASYDRFDPSDEKRINSLCDEAISFYIDILTE